MSPRVLWVNFITLRAVLVKIVHHHVWDAMEQLLIAQFVVSQIICIFMLTPAQIPVQVDTWQIPKTTSAPNVQVSAQHVILQLLHAQLVQLVLDSHTCINQLA